MHSLHSLQYLYVINLVIRITEKVLNYSFIASLLIGRETKKVIQRKTLHSIREYEICLIMLLMDNSIAFRNMNARSQLM